MYVIAQNHTQSAMQQMSGGVIALDRAAASGIDNCLNFISYLQFAVLQAELVYHKLIMHFLCVQYLTLADPACIAYLTAGFPIKRSNIQSQPAFRTGSDLVDTIAVDHNGCDLRLAAVFLVADKFEYCYIRQELTQDDSRISASRILARSLRLDALFFHAFVESVFV